MARAAEELTLKSFGEQLAGEPEPRTRQPPRPRLDLPGAVTGTAGVALVVLAVAQAGPPGRSAVLRPGRPRRHKQRPAASCHFPGDARANRAQERAAIVLPPARAQIPRTVLPPPNMPDRVSWPAAVPAAASPCAGEHPHQAQRSQDDDRHVHRGDPADLVALHDVGA